ncbi:hypothetical protein ACSIGC_07040 [Tenacibaculum sp. ZS6-P6]|uniref:hypothetical protein n=1 Tax=Tenacibaculum sp. ZS6-P6 TaxID=3447503 RepID=UPI003F9454C7
MYNSKNKKNVRKNNSLIHRIKRRIALIITAFMLGMANAMHDEDKMIYGNKHRIEQKKKD